MSKLKDVSDIKDAGDFINGRKKSEVLTDLIINFTGDLTKAEKWWADNGKSVTSRGFLDGFIAELLIRTMDEKEVVKYIEANGSPNNMKDKGFYTKFAKFGNDLRAK